MDHSQQFGQRIIKIILSGKNTMECCLNGYLNSYGQCVDQTHVITNSETLCDSAISLNGSSKVPYESKRQHTSIADWEAYLYSSNPFKSEKIPENNVQTSVKVGARKLPQRGYAEVTKTIKKRSKRNRTAYTTNQLKVLENTFARIKYIDAEKRRKLSESLQISEKSIKVWFQNRRMKEKRESSESSSDSSAEVTTTDLSPRVPSVSPVQEIKMESEANINHFDNKQECAVTSHFQLPDFHFSNYSHYQDATPVMSATEPFANDRSIYPTYYFPTLEDYYCGVSHGYRYYDNGNINTNEAQSAANTVDLNYFQSL